MGDRSLQVIHVIDLNFLLNPPTDLTVSVVLGIALILGMLHGVTPDEHTWPITFSYSIGSYSSKGGMKSGFMFSLGFMIQRAFLTTLGFLGLATIYKTYNLDGPIYIIVGIAMFAAGAYLSKGRYVHIPFDSLLGGKLHHTQSAERIQPHEEISEVPLRMATLHGLIAGFGFGAYATIITFILAPHVPSIIYAPLVGLAFGFGTMLMQIVLGAAFANIMRVKRLTIDQIKFIGKSAAARTLYLGGIAFAIIGVLIAAFPILNKVALNTGSQIPNLDSIGVASGLVIAVVGVIGLGSLYSSYRELKKIPAETKNPS